LRIDDRQLDLEFAVLREPANRRGGEEVHPVDSLQGGKGRGDQGEVSAVLIGGNPVHLADGGGVSIVCDIVEGIRIIRIG